MDITNNQIKFLNMTAKLNNEPKKDNGKDLKDLFKY